MKRSVLLVLAALCGCGGPTEPELDAASIPLDASSDSFVAPDAARTFAIASVEDLGEIPHPSETVVGRDGVSSGVIGGARLWTFGDTFLSHVTPWDMSHVATATGAWSNDALPLVFEQPVDADGVPSQLVPYTTEELDDNLVDATDGWALWPGAVIDTGDDDALLLFQRIKRTMGVGFDGVGIGTARIRPRETVARRDEALLFERSLPPDSVGDVLYGAGGVSVIGETAYFLGCDAGCRLARVPRTRADDRSAFEFFDGSTWVTDIDAAEVVLRGVNAASISWNEHLGRYVSVSSRVLSNDVLVRTAPAIEGPWPTTGLVITPSEGGILAAGEGNDYLAMEQAGLGDASGRSIVISYSRPLGSFRGEVRLARITFE
ncbi:MAG: DUF4185 domain-containing protein [Deltaproteobacteria bacterium]|nr:DUF4185 domain-containing protein [Deltaproteobacteria bacterium]